MKKVESNSDNLDRLSELHDSLILEILSFLDMRDVVKTTLLSKRWKNLWITILCLRFKEIGDSLNIPNFVSRVLNLWTGAYLRKFSIKLSGGYDASLYSNLDMWVVLAKERKIEELCIDLDCSISPKYCLPQCLYECSSLRKLSLTHCSLQVLGTVQWVRLNSLSLSECCLPENVVDKVFSSSPQLETFTFHYHHQNLNIRSSSLKELWICFGGSVCESSVMTINAPNLEALQFLGWPYGKYLLTDVSSLTDVCLDIWDYGHFVGEALLQILPAIQHVVSVSLSSCCFKVDIINVVGLFEIFPRLEMLVIYLRSVPDVFELKAENDMISDENMLRSNLLHLRTVEITWDFYKASMFEFIDILMKHATMLEKIVIQKGRSCEAKPKDVFLAQQKGRSLQRSFPSVEILIHC